MLQIICFIINSNSNNNNSKFLLLIKKTKIQISIKLIFQNKSSFSFINSFIYSFITIVDKFQTKTKKQKNKAYHYFGWYDLSQYFIPYIQLHTTQLIFKRKKKLKNNTKEQNLKTKNKNKNKNKNINQRPMKIKINNTNIQ